MSAAPQSAELAGNNPLFLATADTADRPQGPPVAGELTETLRSIDQLAAVQDRLACWISDLTTLHELTEQLVRTATLESALEELLRAGAALVGARRGLVILEPSDGLGPRTTIGYGLGRADLGTIETVPCGVSDSLSEALHPDLPHERGLHPRHREVAAQLGFGASYALRLSSERTGRLGEAVWFYDEPASPPERLRHLVGLYSRYAAEHIGRQIELYRTRSMVAGLLEELLPSRLPRVPGVRLAVRHRTARNGGGDWYDALPLPEAALGLAVGTVTGTGTSAIAAMGRLRASLRAYAMTEGEDPVAVLSDLELLLRMTEPASSATALFAHVEPADRRLLIAGAGHCPPLIVGERRVEFVETSLSAPLAMLSCWEAPSVRFEMAPGESLLLYTDGLLHHTGRPADAAFALLRSAAASAPATARRDPELLVDHVVGSCLAEAKAEAQPHRNDREDMVLLAARFD